MSELEGLLRASILIARASNRARAAEEELGRLRAENAWLLAQFQT